MFQYADSVRITIMLQYVNSYMFRALLPHYQGVQSYLKQSSNPCVIPSMQNYCNTVNTLKRTGCSNYYAHVHLCTHTLMNLAQFCILGMIQGLDNCFLQLCIPWWWASKTQNMVEFAYWNFIVILKKCGHLLVTL